MRDHGNQLCFVLLLLVSVVPSAAQSFALIADGSSYVPLEFLPNDLQESFTTDTPGYMTVRGIGCVKLSEYAPHLGAGVSYNAEKRRVVLSWLSGDRELHFYVLTTEQALDIAEGLRDMQCRADQPRPTGQQVMETTCSRVIDGDTIELSNGERLRYIGIDTPETSASDPKQERHAEAAERVNRGLVEGRTLHIQMGVGERDRYGRLLGYVYVGGVFVNGALMAGGFAQVMTQPPNIVHAEYFRALGAQAREAGRGLWRVEERPAETTSSGATVQPTPRQSTGGTYYVTKTGSKYHRGSCRCLRKSRVPMTLGDARAAGYGPCGICKPPH